VDLGYKTTIGPEPILYLSLRTDGLVTVANSYSFASFAAMRDAVERTLARTTESLAVPASFLLFDGAVGDRILDSLPTPSATELGFLGKVDVEVGSAVPIPGVAGAKGSLDLGGGAFVRFNRDLPAPAGSVAGDGGGVGTDMSGALIVTDPTTIDVGWRLTAGASGTLAVAGIAQSGSGEGSAALELSLRRPTPQETNGLPSLVTDQIWIPDTLSIGSAAVGVADIGVGLWPGLALPGFKLDANAAAGGGLTLEALGRLGDLQDPATAGPITTVVQAVLSHLHPAGESGGLASPVSDRDLAQAALTILHRSELLTTAGALVRVKADASVAVGVADFEAWVAADASLTGTHLLAATFASQGQSVANQTVCSP
jgi:hypothetical protein